MTAPTIEQPGTTEVEIPVLDLGPYLRGEPGALEKAAEELRHIGEQYGFHYISNHGIPQDLIDQTFAETARFHAQEMEEKVKLKINLDMVGYLPMKGSTTRSSTLSSGNKPNLNEAFFIAHETGSGKEIVNQWPADLPGFRERVTEYFNAMEQLAKAMMPIYARALELEADFFDAAFEVPLANLRMTHYPTSEYGDHEFAIAPHTDSGFLTILAQNKVPGLQIMINPGEWVDAPVIEGTFIVNSGDMLKRWTNDRFLSTAHRAFNKSGTERYAIPYFISPNGNHVMEPIETCVSEDNPFKYPVQTPAEYNEWFMGRNYDHIRQAKGIKD